MLGALTLNKAKSMSYELITKHYPYRGTLGEVVRHRESFFASKDGFPVGTYETLQDAVASLEWKGRAKATLAQ
jgi:hypothetical protein